MRPSRATGGLYHAFMEDIVSKLGFGDWVHVFPTGTRDKDSRSLGPIKPGVARLVCAPETTPVVVPLYHWGMERVKARAAPPPIHAVTFFFI